jgi:hypothetical protein
MKFLVFMWVWAYLCVGIGVTSVFIRFGDLFDLKATFLYYKPKLYLPKTVLVVIFWPFALFTMLLYRVIIFIVDRDW